MELQVYFIIYKITNRKNKKIYIGKHTTADKDDGYMGSGKLLRSAYKKHGIESFVKEILYVFDNEDDMNNMESVIVDEVFVNRKDTYNLTLGGTGGFYHINTNGKNGSSYLQKKRGKDVDYDIKYRANISEGLRNYFMTAQPHLGFKDRKHTEETKMKIGDSSSRHQRGEGNSQFGTKWLFNRDEKRNIKVKEDELERWVNEGWELGRQMSWYS